MSATERKDEIKIAERDTGWKFRGAKLRMKTSAYAMVLYDLDAVWASFRRLCVRYAPFGALFAAQGYDEAPTSI